MTPTPMPRASATYAVALAGSEDVLLVVAYAAPPTPAVLDAYAQCGKQIVPVGLDQAQAIIRNPAAFRVREGQCERRRVGAGGKS